MTCFCNTGFGIEQHIEQHVRQNLSKYNIKFWSAVIFNYSITVVLYNNVIIIIILLWSPALYIPEVLWYLERNFSPRSSIQSSIALIILTSTLLLQTGPPYWRTAFKFNCAEIRLPVRSTHSQARHSKQMTTSRASSRSHNVILVLVLHFRQNHVHGSRVNLACC